MDLETVVDTTSEDVGMKMSVATDLRERLHAAGVQAVREIFEEDILPTAKALCPVGTPPRDPHPGKNRESLHVTFRDNLETGFVSAWVQTASGYGWLIEHGTSHNRPLTKTKISRRHGAVALSDRTPAQPYIMPAMQEFVATIPERQREILESQ